MNESHTGIVLEQLKSGKETEVTTTFNLSMRISLSSVNAYLLIGDCI